MRITFAFLFLLGIALSCVRSTQQDIIPSHFPSINQPVEIQPNKFELGKKFFYDPLFSKDNSISCASCHNQLIAFADSMDFSIGVRGEAGRRNAPALQNLMWSKSYFWDGGVGNIDLIPLNPITNHNELDEDIVNIARKINYSQNYRALTNLAYGADTLTTHQILDALMHFQASLISSNSRFDDYLQGKITLSSDEVIGYVQFQKKCSSCHSGVLQTDYSFRNNGVYQLTDKDLGRYEISLIESDKGKFKVPSLRNVELTAPYMHNSSLKTLEDVLNHYNMGIHSSPTLDSLLVNKISLSNAEKKQIISFLKTLTDREFTSNDKFKLTP